MQYPSDMPSLDELALWNISKRPETTIEYHIPLRNFIGPGTHIIDKINKGVMPYDRNDAVAMLHDVDYYLYAGSDAELKLADQYAIDNFDYTITGRYGKIGLKLRQQLNLPFANSQRSDRIIGKYLVKKIKENPKYMKMIKDYHIKWVSGEK